jgi:hypothetical protein
MLVEEYNVAAAYAALQERVISTRHCVSVKPESTIYRFVNGSSIITANSWTFNPIPYAQFGEINNGDGRIADTMDITFDGSDITSRGDEAVDSILQSILDFPLRDRPIQVGLMVMEPGTSNVIGVISQFVGFIDNTPFTREKGNMGGVNAVLTFKLASFRAYAQRQFVRTYSITDHVSRFPGDQALKWISDMVFRSGKFRWNRMDATANGIGGGGGGRTPNNPNIDLR